jgi:hypothetical protein
LIGAHEGQRGFVIGRPARCDRKRGQAQRIVARRQSVLGGKTTQRVQRRNVSEFGGAAINLTHLYQIRRDADAMLVSDREVVHGLQFAAPGEIGVERENAFGLHGHAEAARDYTARRKPSQATAAIAPAPASSQKRRDALTNPLEKSGDHAPGSVEIQRSRRKFLWKIPALTGAQLSRVA